MTPLVKMCGITCAGDARLAEHAGADYIGVIVEIAGSARSVAADAAGAILSATRCPSVVLLEKPLPDIVPLAARLNPFAVQLVGERDPDALADMRASLACQVWQTVRVPPAAAAERVAALDRSVRRYADAGVDVIVLDTLVHGRKGGTGTCCDWNAAARLARSSPVPVFLAGGISPHTAREAIDRVRPAGLDVSSGIETRPGCKDRQKMADLMRAVRTQSRAPAGR
jgi:phosphoribosylanthranilate isomerase